MSSPATRHQSPVTPSDDEVLVRVDGVGKKFCRSLKKSLWYGVCDIAGELLPGRKRQRVAGSELRVACEEAEVAGSELLVASGNTSAAGASGPATSYSSLATPAAHHNSCDDDLREGEFYAVKNVSFELRRGECLGLIGHNGAGNQAAGQLLGRLPKGGPQGESRSWEGRERLAVRQLRRRSRLGNLRIKRRGKARINTTLLKMLNGLIKPTQADWEAARETAEGSPQGETNGSERINGRIASLLEVGTGFHPELTGWEPEGWEARRTSNRRLAQRVQRRRGGANQNIFLNVAILGMRKAEPRRWVRRDRLPQAGPQGFANRGERKPNFDCGRGSGRWRCGIPQKMLGQNEGCRQPR